MSYRPLLLMIFTALPIFFFTACTQEEVVTETVTRATAAPEKTYTEIPLTPPDTEALAYNPADNTLTLISRKEASYTAFTLKKNGTWAPQPSRWKIKQGYFLDNFVYGADGRFYACLKHYTKKGYTRQSLVRLKGRGKIQTVHLKGLNQVPSTRLDSSIKKRGGAATHNITDIKFCGTALAITYSNYAVKFYNIEEGEALGASSITGQAGQNIFYDYGYLSESLWDNRKPLSFSLYDIRSGELRRTISLDASSDAFSTREFYLSNVQDKFYLLTKGGLYICSPNAGSFQLAENFNALGISEKNRILYFQAAKKRIFYILHQDADAKLHLTRFSLS